MPSFAPLKETVHVTVTRELTAKALFEQRKKLEKKNRTKRELAGIGNYMANFNLDLT